MKVIDTRDQTVMEGRCIAIIPANQEVSREDMKRFYDLLPGHRAYDIMSRPQPQERMVLERFGGTEALTDVPNTPSYYIVPRYDFYRIEE